MSFATEKDALLRSTVSDLSDVDPDPEDGSKRMFQQMKEEQTIAVSSNSEQIQQEYQSIKEAFKDHLMEVDQGDDLFLEMNLTKNLSLLPSKPELEQAEEEISDAFGALSRTFSMASPNQRKHQQSSIPEHEVKKSVDDDNYDEGGKRPPLKAYIILGSAVVALSSIGPFLAKQRDVSPNMKIVWRFQGTVLMLAPFAIRSIVLDGFPKLTMAQWGTFVLAAASYSVLCCAFAFSVNYITVADATILTNSQSVLLVAVKLLLGQRVLFIEGLGVLIAFSGGILCAKESAEGENSPANGWWSIWGDCLGIISSIGGIGYIVLGKSLRSHMPVLIFMVLNMFTASILILLFMWATGETISFGRDIHHGLFGYMNLRGDRLPLELATVIICNVMGTMGYVRAFKYFSSVIIAVAALLEPVVAAFTATALGVGVLPGVEGWVGNFLVAAGTLAVLYPTVHPEQPKSPKTPRTPFPRMQSPHLHPRPPKAGRDIESPYPTAHRPNPGARQSISERPRLV